MLKNITQIWLALLFLAACSGEKPPQRSPQQVARAWAELTLDLTHHTPANSPTFASRALGYIGLTMYESIVPGHPSHRSVAEALQGLGALPAADPALAYDWVLALNAGQAEILRAVYLQAADSSKQKVDKLESEVLAQYRASQPDTAVVTRSVAFGKAVAKAIAAWAETDGGHRGYLRNFDKTFTHEVFPGSWKPPLYAQSVSHNPLHPFWGQNRTFLQANAEIPIPAMIPFDSTPGSAYYQQFLKVYETEQALTQEQKEIAIWWGDDPGETFTPPGHSYYLATIALKKTNPDLIIWAETYARLGMAVADAFIKCWAWKYHYFSERPNTFIPQYIDPSWESFWPDPPFPAFPSGHAIQAASAAGVLTALFGEPFALTDSAHVGRPPDGLREVEFKARSFNSFWEVAYETARSRHYGGIHTEQDNEAGLEAGKIIASHINQLPWRASSTASTSNP